MKKEIFAILQAFTRRKNTVNWLALRSTTPVSQIFGLERGLPIDRYYIESFLSNYKNFITGDVLEVGDARYTKKFGLNISSSYILKYKEHIDRKQNLDDLTQVETLPQKKFDCVICVQTLQMIYDLSSALKGLKYLLKDSGVLLVTVPSISQISAYDMELYGDYWRFTRKAIATLFQNEFTDYAIDIYNYGNVLSCISFLEGISTQELTIEELNYLDKNYTMLLGVVVKKINTTIQDY